MAEGLEVTIKYRGEKYHKVASPPTSSAAFAILKKDLAHLRVHSPSQKNVQRVDGSFILNWPTAATTQKVAGLADSLHTRWFKLCSDDPEALKLREFLSIESITMKQGGVLIRAAASRQASQAAPPGTLLERLGDPLLETGKQPTSVSVPVPSLPAKPPPPVIPPPRVTPRASRSDGQPPPHLKRRISSNDGPESPSSLTRQRLDLPEAPTTSPLQSINAPSQQSQPPTSPERDSSIPVDATNTIPQPTQDVVDATPFTHAYAPTTSMPPQPQTIPTSPAQEPDEMTPQPIPNLAPPSGPLNSSPDSSSGPGARPPPPNNHPMQSTCPTPPYTSSSSPGNGDPHALRRRDPDVNRLTRELWDTRRQLTAMQAREQVILNGLERLGARPESTSGADRNGVLRDELSRLEVELEAERARRMRAERALSDVERECRAPFVVPVLFQAFLSISELSN